MLLDLLDKPKMKSNMLKLLFIISIVIIITTSSVQMYMERDCNLYVSLNDVTGDLTIETYSISCDWLFIEAKSHGVALLWCVVFMFTFLLSLIVSERMCKDDHEDDHEDDHKYTRLV